MKFVQTIVLLMALALQSAMAEIIEHGGLVAEVQLVDVTELSDQRFLILSLEDGQVFHLPEATQLAAGQGVQVAVRHLPASEGALPVACSVHVLALPIRIEGEDVMQPARRPFEVYRNPQEECAH